MATRARRVLGRFRRFVACNLGLSWNLKCVCRQVTATGRSGRIKSLGGKGPRPSGGENNQSDFVLLKNPARSLKINQRNSMVFTRKRERVGTAI